MFGNRNKKKIKQNIYKILFELQYNDYIIYEDLSNIKIKCISGQYFKNEHSIGKAYCLVDECGIMFSNSSFSYNEDFDIGDIIIFLSDNKEFYEDKDLYIAKIKRKTKIGYSLPTPNEPTWKSKISFFNSLVFKAPKNSTTTVYFSDIFFKLNKENIL